MALSFIGVFSPKIKCRQTGMFESWPFGSILLYNKRHGGGGDRCSPPFPIVKERCGKTNVQLLCCMHGCKVLGRRLP